ncbi:MAG TPA: acylphosphatase [Pyrinomonadaceae bacterium]
MIARRFFVSGMVQGVGFRYFVQRSAATHQVKGFVRNLPDGRVEAFAQGSQKDVNEFRDDLGTGPRFSKVEHVEEIVEDVDDRYSTFRIDR